MLTPLRNRRRAFSILRAAGVGVSGGRGGGRWRRRKLRRGPRGAGARAARPPQARGGVERARRGVRFALLQLNLHPDHVAHRDARRTASGGGGDRPSTERRTQHKGVRRAGEQREEKGEQPHGAATTEDDGELHDLVSSFDAARSRSRDCELRVGAPAMYEEAVADDWSVKAARWLAKPDSYFVWGPALTLIVLVVFLCNCWRDVKRLFFNNMPKTKSHHTAAVIWLHGTGDAGAGFAFLKKACERELRHIKWVLPDAPRTPLTAAQGAPRRAWVDVAAMPIKLERKPDDARLAVASDRVDRLVAAEVAKGIPASRIVLGGFSQGAAVAVWAAARPGAAQIAGVVAWSGYALCADELPRRLERSPNRSAAHLVCHGTHEPGAPQCAAAATSEQGPRHARTEYAMDHECARSSSTTKAFLRRAVPPARPELQAVDLRSQQTSVLGQW